MYQKYILHICIKRTGVFYTLMDKPTRTLVSARCKGGKTNALTLSFKLGPKLEKFGENQKSRYSSIQKVIKKYCEKHVSKAF